MPYYTECENCGANLDPGEVCDCIKKAVRRTNPDSLTFANMATTNSNIHIYYTKNSVKSQGG